MIKSNNINRLLNKKSGKFATEELSGEGVRRMTGKGIEEKKQIEPLSESQDPRVKKLKKELEKLDVAPKPKYIYFNLPVKK